MTYANALELYMLELINEERTSRGLNPLRLETNLNQSAEDHSIWMLRENEFSHTGQGGSSATERMIDAGFNLSGSWGTAENIAVQSARGEAGYRDDVRDLHNSLMNSSGHRANILNPDLEYIGIGIEVGSFTYDNGFTANSVIVTQNFGRTTGSVDLDDLGGERPADTAPNASGGADDLAGSSGHDIIRGLGGADTITGQGGNDTLLGGDQNDRLSGANGNDSLEGGNGRDFLSGGNNNDIMFGLAGADTLYGGSGKDTLNGSGGNDRMFGEDGNDRLNGANQNDFGKGGAGNDTLYGGNGNDTLYGGSGNDRLFGGGGNDKLFGGNQNDFAKGGTGRDSLTGGNGNDTLIGENGDDRLTGGTGNDRLSGGSQNDRATGGNGHDSLFGGNGKDTLIGQSGNDSLFGGNGNDILSGGAGSDTFVFNTNSGKDRIRDGFDAGSDVLRIDNVTNADDVEISIQGGNTVFAFGSSTVTVEGQTDDVDGWTANVVNGNLEFEYFDV